MHIGRKKCLSFQKVKVRKGLDSVHNATTGMPGTSRNEGGLKFLIVFLPHSFRGSGAERILKPQSPLYLLELVDDEIRSA